MSDVTLSVNVDSSGLKAFESEFGRFSETIERSGERAFSTFEKANQQLEVLGQKLSEIASNGDVFQALNQSGQEFSNTLKVICENLEKVSENLSELGIKGQEQSDSLTPLQERLESIRSRYTDFIDDIKNSESVIEKIHLGLLFLTQVILDIGTVLGSLFILGRIKTFLEDITKTGIIKYFTDLFAIITRSKAFQLLIRAITVVAGLLAGVLTAKVLAIIGIIAGLIAIIVLAVKHWDLISEAIRRFVNFAGENLGAFGSFVEEKFFQMLEFISGVWESVKQITATVWEAIKSAVGSAIEGIKEFFASIGESLSAVWDGASEKATEVWEGIKTTISNAVESIKGFAGDIKTAIVNAFTEAFESVKNLPGNFINSIKEGLKGINIFGGDEQPETEPPSVTEEDAENISQLNNNLVNVGETLTAVNSKFDEFGVRIFTMDELIEGATASLELNAGSALQTGKNIEDLNQKASRFNETNLRTAESLNRSNEAFSNTATSVAGFSNILDQLPGNKLSDFFDLPDTSFLDPQENVQESIQQIGQGFVDTSEIAKESLDSIGVFASDIAANINDSFADLIFNGLKGNFDNLGELWDSTLDSMLDAVSQFAATLISNPIRIGIESVLSGFSGGGPIGVKDGQEAGITNFLGAGLGGGISTILSKAGLFAAETIPLVGTIINGAIALAITGIAVIKGLLDKSPRLDLDFDQIRDDAGKSLGVAAQVFQFLDEDVFNNEIFSRSVSRQAGLGLGSELPNVIREAIEGQIFAIQDIINQLPAELSAQLNDALLNTSVDIESKIKGDRLLEFDEKTQFGELVEGSKVVSFENARKSKELQLSEVKYRLAA